VITPANDRSEIVKRLVWFLAVAVVLTGILAPIYMLLKYSISDMSTINTGGRPIPLWPNRPTFAMFTYLFKDREFWEVVGNSSIIAVSTVLLTSFLSIPAGYVLARYNFPLKRFFLILLVSVRLFPDISSVIPIATFFIKTNLHSSYTSVVLAHTLLALPYVIFMATSAFEFVPRDIEEQAMVMGANRFTIFIKILVPVVFPSLVAGAIYTFLLSWDEFIFAHFLLDTGGQIQTLTLYLNQNLSFSPPQNVLAAISVCLSVPVMIFTFIVQRYMVSGMVAGAVK
jgi:ABC-type glycerol-3-phosphate transport system permease component